MDNKNTFRRELDQCEIENMAVIFGNITEICFVSEMFGALEVKFSGKSHSITLEKRKLYNCDYFYNFLTAQ